LFQDLFSLSRPSDLSTAPADLDEGIDQLIDLDLYRVFLPPLIFEIPELPIATREPNGSANDLSPGNDIDLDDLQGKFSGGWHEGKVQKKAPPENGQGDTKTNCL
jgi:hypothetical protein